jgi:hypothetical protein
MTNLKRLTAILERERYARQWDDEHVAGAILAELGIDPVAEVVSEAEVHAAPELASNTAAAPMGDLQDAQTALNVATDGQTAATSSNLEHG